MKKKLLDHLVCQECNSAFRIRNEIEKNHEIKEGELHCAHCDSKYQIVNYIPRFVQTDQYVESFSLEWKRFRKVQLDIFNPSDDSESEFAKKTGWNRENIKGNMVLDVGVGAGRFADVVSRWGGEVVGIDLSYSVDAAYENIGSRENVHLIQADLFSLPLRERVFDKVYSMGVLHHTPNTRAAFKSILKCLRDGGELSVFIYCFGHYHLCSDIWRKITTRLPNNILYYLTAISIPLYYVHKIPYLGTAAQFVFPTANWKDPRRRWLDTFDWYSPKYQWKHTWPEVFQWFDEEGFTDIKLFQVDREGSIGSICMRGKKG